MATNLLNGWARRGVIVASCLLATGCAVTPRFAPPGLASSREEATELCHLVSDFKSPIRSVRAVVESTIRSAAGDSGSFRYGIISNKPYQLRIDVLPVEGAYTLGLIVIGKDGAVVIDTTKREFSEGPNSEELLREFLGLQGLTQPVIVSLLTGVVPEESCQQATLFTGEADGLMVLDPRSHIAWTADTASGGVRRVEVLDADNERVEARADIRADGVGAPREIHLTVYSPMSASATMIVRRLQVNPEVPESLFNVPIPAGYTRVK